MALFASRRSQNLRQRQNQQSEHAEPIAFAHARFTPFEIATETPPQADADAATE